MEIDSVFTQQKDVYCERLNVLRTALNVYIAFEGRYIKNIKYSARRNVQNVQYTVFPTKHWQVISATVSLVHYYYF